MVKCKKLEVLEVFSRFYLSEQIGGMPYLHWRAELKNDTRYFSEAEKWNMPDPF
jgi:hypothetical protein